MDKPTETAGGDPDAGAQKKKPAAKKGGGGDKDEEDEALEGSLMSAIVTDKPDVKWSDVCGLDAAKTALQEAVIVPIKFP